MDDDDIEVPYRGIIEELAEGWSFRDSLNMG